ncbi:glycosyltransferase family 39 protein [Flavobacterium sp.]|uniref:glycosyltransferase family 39 protein n=1 Tax=Flavobacterium sp. TaxID=239 RepID=UPI0025FA94B4|nr:glycosyltransferase family 39 protein [Flavobacterium sp.]
MKIIKVLKENYLLVLILALGAFLRFYKLDFQSIWLDETHTMIEGNPNISYKEFYDIMVFREQMPYFYFLCVKAFSFIFGHTTYIVRLLSAIFGLISIHAIYLLGREIYNKKTGLISAALLSVNYFHLTYSQEARPYILLSLFVILSFYRLVVFIKNANIKNAILYALFANLMINTHFFGLFILVSQSLIILFFLFDLPKEERFKFFKLSALSGIITLLLWYPSLKIFLLVTEIKSFWILPPALDVYTQMFKEFFGNSEAVLMLVFLATTFYFIRLFGQKKEPTTSIKENKMLFSFVIIATWIFITSFIPLVRSYLDIPMIISRYFIGVLPAVILIIAIGMSSINSSLVRRIIVLLLIIVSLTDIVVIKDYYNKTTKTQFREIAEIIIKRNKNKEKVVSSFGWNMSYFFNQDPTSTPLLNSPSEKNITVDSSLQNYIMLMKDKTIPMESFWYMDGNSKPYKLTPEEEAFLNDNFTLESSIEKVDAWTKHYVSKTIQNNDNQNVAFGIKNFQPSNLDQNGNMLMFENGTIKSPALYLETGSYVLKINANSLPEKPLNGENAHIIIKIGDKEIGNYYLSELPEKKEKIISFENTVNQHCKVTLTYDNDLSVYNLDRNLIIYNIQIKKKNL